MQGVIIIDEQQLIVANATEVMTSFGADKFTIRISTASNEFHDGLTEEQMLDAIISDPVVAPPSGGTPSIQFDTTAANNASPGTVPEVSPRTTRVVVESSDTPPIRATFASSVMGARATSTSAPSNKGILLEGAAKPAVGQQYALNTEQMHVLTVLRREFELHLLHHEDALKRQYPVIKGKGLVRLKSSPFTAVFGDAFRVGVHTLVTTEQEFTRGHDRENFLCVEEGPKIVIDALTDEAAGTGTFHLEEVVSVYENPETYRTKVDNGKD